MVDRCEALRRFGEVPLTVSEANVAWSIPTPLKCGPRAVSGAVKTRELDRLDRDYWKSPSLVTAPGRSIARTTRGSRSRNRPGSLGTQELRDKR